MEILKCIINFRTTQKSQSIAINARNMFTNSLAAPLYSQNVTDATTIGLQPYQERKFTWGHPYS